MSVPPRLLRGSGEFLWYHRDGSGEHFFKEKF